MQDGSEAIFISYRRAETRDIAGRLADRLMDRFGDDQVFVDVEDIEPGVDFVAEIERAVTRCRVLVVVIGPTWHSVGAPAGGTRLHDPHDAVAIEVRTALAAGVRVVPVLVDGAEMPRADALPEPLRPLTRINAARVDHESFRLDSARLVSVLERALGSPPAAAASGRGVAARRLAGRAAGALGDAAVRSWQRRREEGLFPAGFGQQGGRHAAPRSRVAAVDPPMPAPQALAPGPTPAPRERPPAPGAGVAIVPTESVGGVRLGSPVSRVSAEFGVPETSRTDFGTTHLIFRPRGLEIVVKDGRVVWFFVHAGGPPWRPPGAPPARPYGAFRGTTPNGISVRSARGDVEAAYGPRPAGNGPAPSRGAQIFTVYPHLGLWFHFATSDPDDRTATVDHILVGSPTV